MRLINFLLAIIFMIFAFLQVSNPDPVLWILVYGITSVVCIMAMFNYHPRRILVVLLTAYVIYGLFLWGGEAELLKPNNFLTIFEKEASINSPLVNESRGILGLLACVAILTFNIVRSFKGN